MEEMTFEELVAAERGEIQKIKDRVAALLDHEVFRGECGQLAPGNVPMNQHGNMKSNLVLSFRCLEDARMRLGKVMQASQGGVSCFDRPTGESEQIQAPA